MILTASETESEVGSNLFWVGSLVWKGAFMRLTRREFIKSTLTAGTTAMMSSGAIRRKSGAPGYSLGESPISVKPLQQTNVFGVELSHRDFSRNIIRYRIPEYWFCGLLLGQEHGSCR
jgi:hypothetical protein